MDRRKLSRDMVTVSTFSRLVGLGGGPPWFLTKCVGVWVDLRLVAMIAIDSENAGCWGRGDCVLPSKGNNGSVVITVLAR